MHLVPISRDNHINKSWFPRTTFGFAREQTLIPITARELPNAALRLPIGILRSNNKLDLVMIAGELNGKSLYIDSKGKWLVHHLPSIFRYYPFVLARTEENKMILCFDEKSGLMSDEIEGTPFFDEAGELADEVKKIWIGLQERERDKLITDAMLTELEKQDLLEPWSINLKEADITKSIKGILRISEIKVNSLPDADFLKLRKNGALAAVYLHLFSTLNEPVLSSLNLKSMSSATKQKSHFSSGFKLSEDGPLNFNF
jgi:hypothetical protein